MPGPANIKFRSTDSAALWLLCLTGETQPNILLLMKLHVIFDTSMETGVVTKGCIRGQVQLLLLRHWTEADGTVLPNYRC